MRRITLDLMRCAVCHAGSLVPEESLSEPMLVYGPVKCVGCGHRFAVNEGLIDCVGDRIKRSPAQQALELPWVARSWERYVRPAISTMLARSRMDRDSEYTIIRNMLDPSTRAIIDLGCGPGAFLHRLARDFPESAIIGVDVSKPMLEEAMAHASETGQPADFVRAQVPPLPFVNASIGAIVASGFLHFVEDLDALFREVARVLKPRGAFIASTFEAPSAGKPIQASAGLHSRSEADLKAATARAGLIAFERVRVGSFFVVRCERP